MKKEKQGIDFSKDNVYDAIHRPDLKPAPHTAGSEWEKSFGQYYERFLKLYRKALPNEKGNFPDEMAYDLFLELKSLIQKLLQTARESEKLKVLAHLGAEDHKKKNAEYDIILKARSQVIDEAVEIVKGESASCGGYKRSSDEYSVYGEALGKVLALLLQLKGQ